MPVKSLTTNPNRHNGRSIIAADPSFTQLFKNPKDPRIEFFGQRLRSDELALLAQLYKMVFLETPLSHQKIAFRKTTLHYPKIRSCHGSIVESPGRDSSILGEIALRVLPKTPKKNLIWSSPLLKKAGNVSLGMPQVLCGTFLSIVLLKLFWESASQLDDQQNQIIQSRIQNGTCQWVPRGCSLSLGDRADCYLPQDECTSIGYRTPLAFAIMCIMGAAVFNMLSQCSHRHIELMQAEFNDPRHDAFLNSLCKRNQTSPLCWSNLMQVNGQTCTLRTLMLIFLSSCNKHLYEKLFSEILPNLAIHRKVTLTHEDYTMRLRSFRTEPKPRVWPSDNSWYF